MRYVREKALYAFHLKTIHLNNILNSFHIFFRRKQENCIFSVATSKKQSNIFYTTSYTTNHISPTSIPPPTTFLSRKKKERKKSEFLQFSDKDRHLLGTPPVKHFMFFEKHAFSILQNEKKIYLYRI